MSAQWRLAREWAALGLPGLPATERGMRKRADAEGWRSREAPNGRGREYHLRVLPAEAQDEFLRRMVAAVPAPATLPALPVPATARIADWQRRTMDARAVVLAELDRLAEFGGVSRAIASFVAAAKAGRLDPQMQRAVQAANARAGKEGGRVISAPTLFRWLAERKQGGVAAIAPLAPAQPAALPAWAAPMLRLWQQPQQPKLTEALRQLPAHLPAGVAPPSYAAARRFLAGMSIVERERGRRGPNALLAVQAFKRRSTEHQSPLDVVTADGHSFKGDVAHPHHGRPFRPEVVSLLDTTTRYVFGWSAGLSEASHLVMDALRRGIETLGLFAILYTDNGSGFIAKAMTDETLGFLTRIGATHHTSTPGRAQARGKIERLQQTLWQPLERSLPTYAGRDMDREARRRVVKLVERDIRAHGASRALVSWADFQTLIQQRIAGYNARPHRSLPRIRDAVTGLLRHQSPAEALEAHRARGWAPVLAAPDMLDDLFRPYELRATHRGEVTLAWGRYFAHELVPHGGTTVRVGYDMADGGRVWVRTAEDGRLICIALRDGNVTPEMPQSAIEHARAKREATRLRTNMARRDEIIAEGRGPGLIQHAPTIAPHWLNATIDEAHAERAGDVVVPVAQIEPQESNEDRWWRRATRLLAAQAEGATLSETDARWLAINRQEGWFQARLAAASTPDPTRKSA